MENTLLIGLSRQVTLTRKLDIIANNLANSRTAGYKAENPIFEEFLMPTAAINDLTGLDRHLSYVIDSGLARDFTNGPIEMTGNDFDVAISGNGWLVVETPAGERYTRNGELTLNSDGELVTNQGLRVLGDAGPILFSPDETDIVISGDGAISSSEGLKGSLRVVEFENQGSMQKEGDSLYSTDAAPRDAQNFTITQGAIERSNVRAVVETARMIEVTRAYVSNAKMLEQLSEARRNAIRQLSETPA
ncbi:MAG: flagellar basal-body rod protein FlgF [Rhizobiales bacterium]|nr:flagellar basal-body rod protein FlgF [Hyphomicrobiales bacterium]